MNQSSELRSDRLRSNTPALLEEAARSLFARRGYDGTSVRAITERAGANLGAIRYHFGSKRALYESVLEHALLPLAEGVGEVLEKDAPPIERLGNAIRVYFDFLRANPEVPPLLLQEIAAGKPPPETVLRIMGGLARALAEVVGRGQKEETIRRGDPRLMAVSLISQPVHFSLLRDLMARVVGLDANDPAVFEGIVEHAIAFARGGLAAGPGSIRGRSTRR